MTRDQGITPIATGLLAQESAAAIANIDQPASNVPPPKSGTLRSMWSGSKSRLFFARAGGRFISCSVSTNLTGIGGSNQRPLQLEQTVPGGRCGDPNITHKEYQS